MHGLYSRVVVVGFVIIAGGFAYSYGAKNTVFPKESPSPVESHQDETISAELVTKFNELSQNGNSTCSADFKDSVVAGSVKGEIKGSCCSAMDLHRYAEQVEALKKYDSITEIPSDPYDVDAGLAQRLAAYYDVQLTHEQQQAYDYAMANSNEKGPCCCKCWRWYVYGGLGKLLIQKYNFTGEQVTDVWNLSDGCGGAGDHAGH